MTKSDEIFERCEYLIYSDCSETGLVLWIRYSDSMEIKYEKMDINTIQNFIENVRKNNDIDLVIPIEQSGKIFYNIFIIKNGVFYVFAYEGKDHFIDIWESDIETQLPFLEIICKAIIECINTENMCEKTFF